MQDASSIWNQIVGGLEGLASESLRMIGEDRTFMEMWGWNCPAMNRHEFAAMIRAPISRIQSIISKPMEDADFGILQSIPAQIEHMKSQSFPNLPGGNAFHVYLVVDSLLIKISNIVDKYALQSIDWDEIEDKNIFPVELVKKLRQLENEITGISQKSKGLDKKIENINSASSAVSTLPSDLKNLNDAKDSFVGAQKIASDHQAAIEQHRTKSDDIVKTMEKTKAEIDSIIERSEGALAAATTKSLGTEFEKKALELGKQVNWLSAFLVMIILVGAVITYFRIEFIHSLMLKPPVNMQLIWAHVVMTFFSLAGPIWLAWLVTKQLGQRFRLSEDYAFKASVSKAYAGYKHEAQRLDPDFVKRLYSTALNRIDEAPLRYVENENHGSPWHEALKFGKRPDNGNGNGKEPE
jgi:hypothetical protein